MKKADEKPAFGIRNDTIFPYMTEIGHDLVTLPLITPDFIFRSWNL